MSARDAPGQSVAGGSGCRVSRRAPGASGYMHRQRQCSHAAVQPLRVYQICSAHLQLLLRLARPHELAGDRRRRDGAMTKASATPASSLMLCHSARELRSVCISTCMDVAMLIDAAVIDCYFMEVRMAELCRCSCARGKLWMPAASASCHNSSLGHTSCSLLGPAWPASLAAPSRGRVASCGHFLNGDYLPYTTRICGTDPGHIAYMQRTSG